MGIDEGNVQSWIICRNDQEKLSNNYPYGMYGHTYIMQQEHGPTG